MCDTKPILHVSIYRGFDIFKMENKKYAITRSTVRVGVEYDTLEKAMDAVDVNRVEWLKS